MTEIPSLRRGVEMVVGMDDQPMLFDSVSGKYHRLGPAAALVVGQFDGRRTLEEIIADLPQRVDEATAARIAALVDNLRDKRLLEGRRPGAAPSRWSGGLLLPRVIVWRRFSRALDPLVRLLHRLPAPALSWVFLALAVAGFAAGAARLSDLSTMERPGPALFALAVGIQLVSIVAHESWHAIVAGYLGTPVRGLGVALMFWVIPIAYVDRTDSYRVRSRSGRAMLAVAGMCSDGVVCGLEALVAATSQGAVHQVAVTLCLFQITMLVNNLNPLTQSDGVAAMEALTGLVNLRGRAMFLLDAVIRGRQIPPAMLAMGGAARLGYLTYGFLCVVLAVAVMTFFIASMIKAAMTALGGLL